jgi:single-strand DNA-binding protein
MKNISIAGRATKDCEVKQNQDRSFASFSVAVDDGYGENKGVMYFDVTYHREKVAEFITKGTGVAVTGELKQREYNGKTYLSIRASLLSIMGGGKPKEDQTGGNVNPADMDDEIPF